jgi:hypothetical protein
MAAMKLLLTPWIQHPKLRVVAATASVLCGVWSSVDLDTARFPKPCWSVSSMTALSGSVAPDPGSALALAFADREPADDAHSSFVLHAHELASVGFVGEGIRAARG